LDVLETLGNILISSVALLFAVVISGQILLPIIYGLPRAINLVIKGHARIVCIPLYLISVFIGLALLYLIHYFFPFLITKAPIKSGLILGLVLFIYRSFFSLETRLDMSNDFNNFMEPYLKERS
jgi:hypothetical protein